MPPRKDPAQTKADYSSLVPAVEQASRILLALAEGQPSKTTLTDICNSVGIHKSKGYAILNTLQHFAFVQRSPDSKTYSLGPGLLFLASKVLDNLDVREVAAPLLRELSRETNSTAFLGLISENHVFVVAKDEGSRDIGVTIRLGHRFPLTWGAHGKAIVAFLPEAERKHLLGSAKLYFHGSSSKFDRHRLDREIAECRRSGFAVDLGDMQIGIHGVASAVKGPSGKVIGALAVIGTFPQDLAPRYGAKVTKAAQGFSQMVGGTHVASKP
ncbi:MAG: IclR family transcriptional regulator [Desulfomonile tiedjei]|nr:IclR family transcriptional regulator [Desulfomonile tiedjei]